MVEEAVVAPAAGRSIEVVGPEDLSFDTIVERFGAELGRTIPVAHVPLLMLRAMAIGMRPFKPVLADQVAAANVLETTNRRARTQSTGDGMTMVRGVTTFDSVIHGMVLAASRPEGLPNRA